MIDNRDGDLAKIKDLFNSRNNQNLFMAWHMLKNRKTYERGEFRDVFKTMFNCRSTKNKTKFELLVEGSHNEDIISFFLYKYKYAKKEVFSYSIRIINSFFDDKSGVPIEFIEGAEKMLFNKVINYLETFIDRI